VGHIYRALVMPVLGALQLRLQMLQTRLSNEFIKWSSIPYI